MPTPASTVPYEDDLEYLADEVRWVEARARKIYVARGLRAVDGHPEDGKYKPVQAEPKIIRARHAELVEQERQLRTEIDARLAATWAARESLGLDTIQEAHDLNAFERAVLLLAAAPVLDPDIEDIFAGACRMAHLTIGGVFTLLEMGVRERVEHRKRFREDGALVGADLIQLEGGDPEHSPEELLEIPVKLSAKAFHMMIGQAGMGGPETEPEAEQEPEEQSSRSKRRRCRDRDEQDVDVPNIAIPELRLSDVVVHGDLALQLDEVVAAARGRHELLQRWGLGRHIPYGRGVAALFFGAPGVGKTHAALAIAGQLGRPIIEAAYPDIVSKWVGESSKNLAALFSRAALEQAVLLIDEADSLVGQRGQAYAHPHDDAVVNVLLKELERHEGVVVMATNLRERLDGALGRRLSYQLCFPEPGPSERARLWELLVPSEAPVEGELDFVDLGVRWEMTGGLIKNSILKAAFRAARQGVGISMSLLTAAAAEEVAAQAGAGGQDARIRVLGFGR